MRKSILITGNAGLIGSRMADWILENHPEYEVVGIDNLFGGYIENVDDRVVFYKRELSSDSIKDIFDKHEFEYVFHFAAYAAEGLSPFMRMFNDRNNMLSTDNIINECIMHDVKRLVYTSSMSVYGHGFKNGTRFDENDTLAPIDPYAVSKYACETNIKIAGEQHGLDWCIIRPHNCYSDDTEILTENGWKLFSDLLSGEKVLTLNIDEMKMEYHEPIEYHKYFVDDYLYNFHTNGVDLMVTGDHNMVTRTSSKNKIQKITASEIYENPQKYYYYETLKSGYKTDGEKCDDIIIPEVLDSIGRSMDNNHQNGGERHIKAEDWFSFLGWYISEGCCYKTKSNYTVVITQDEKIHKENCNNIKGVIERMGFKYYVNGNDIKIHSKQLYVFLKSLFPESDAHNKYIPREYLSYNKECLVNLYESMMAGDGNSDFSRYSTSSKQLADDFSELLLKIGKCGNIFKEERENGLVYRIGICKNTNPSFGDMYTKKINCDKIKYEGYVYDITVPNHIIYVRRNGKSCWGSNCYGIGQNIWDKYRNVLGIWMYQALNDKPMTIYGDGEQTRAFSYIDDCLEPFWKAATNENTSKEIINVGGIEPYSINSACETLCDIIGYSDIVHLEARHEVKHAVPTYQKSIDLLEYKQTTSLKDGLSEMWEWAKKQPMRERMKWDNYEITKGLYEYWK